MEDNTYIQHHGVKGMKWGVRKDRVAASRDNYKNAKRAEKAALKQLNNRKQYSTQFNLTGISKNNADKQRYNKNLTAYNKARANTIMSKAQLQADKKNSAAAAARAERRVYKQGFGKTGVRDSTVDVANHGSGKVLYSEIAKKKGRNYAQSVETSYKRQAIGVIVGSAALSAGSLIVSEILANK